jgi:hypothetical protein
MRCTLMTSTLSSNETTLGILGSLALHPPLDCGALVALTLGGFAIVVVPLLTFVMVVCSRSLFEGFGNNVFYFYDLVE